MTCHCSQNFIFLGQLLLLFGRETEKTVNNLTQIVEEPCGHCWRENPDLLHLDLLRLTLMAMLSLHSLISL